MAKELIPSPTTGVLMEHLCKDGDTVQAGDPIATVESMKMQFEITTQSSGVIHYLTAEGCLAGMDDIVAEVQIAPPV